MREYVRTAAWVLSAVLGGCVFFMVFAILGWAGTWFLHWLLTWPRP